MKVINYKEIPPIAMDNELVKNVAGRVLLGKNDGANNFCMRLFEMGQEGHTPRHSHDWEHEVFVVSGKGEVLLKGKWHPMSEGTAVFVPPNEEHQFRNTGQASLSFLCVVPPNSPEI